MAALIDARPCTCTQEERANGVIAEPRRGPAELFNARGLSFGDDHGGRFLEEFRLHVDLLMGWLRQVKTIGLVTRHDTKGRIPINRYSCARSTRGDFGSEKN